MRNKISNPLRLASNQGARSGRKEQAWSTHSAALTLGLLALTPVIDECFTWIRSESILEKIVYPVLLTHDCSEVYILRYARREKDVTSAQNRTRSQTVVVADMTILEPISASMSASGARYGCRRTTILCIKELASSSSRRPRVPVV